MNALPARVLVVEDDDVIRELIRLNLELEGFEVFTAVDGQDCLDRIGYIDPHVVTLDVMMPRLDGWTTAERLRAQEWTRTLPIVLVTARTQEEDVRRGERIGVDAYVTKPFDPDALIDVVRALLGGRG
ncbi:response regulator transcription factor [Nocardiopsis flavescens]|uniref:Response regulator receiver domain-containing protein n=1 Tax=Nocardiopsis flavescens TaxID=758803 RepID=A0A1M6K7Q8_9ACTN|nr:response regulator [Nocardiopsis flavescens]SHJ54989.1 Response regulator receiver domain-containing protein [Nocardiopsis flavescens]